MAETGCVVFLLTAGCFLTAIAVLPIDARGTTFFVGGTGPGNYTSIQTAVNAAKGGDLIYVYRGIYRENIVVSKGVILLGQGKAGTVIDGGGSGDVIRVMSRGVTISGFTITNTVNGAGVRATDVDNVWVTNSIFSSNMYGFLSISASPGMNASGLLDRDDFHSNTYAVYIVNSDNNSIIRNTFRDNNYGVRLVSSSNNRIHHNNFLNNTWQGSDDRFTPWDNGYPSGGNYYSDYGGMDNRSGPNQDLPGGDGIGDSPEYIRDGTNTDRYPLMHPYGSPSAPRNLMASRGDRKVALVWDAPISHGDCNVSNYRLHRGMSSGGETLMTETGAVLNYTDAGLVNGQTFYYRISALNCNGEGPMSNEVSAIPATFPGPPSGLYAQDGDELVILTWSPPANDGGSPISNYRLYRGTSPGRETFLVETGNILTHIDTGLKNGMTYYYTVAAKNAVGEGANSTELFATPATVPSEPLNLKAMAGDHQVTLSWSPPASNGGSPVGWYRIYSGAISGGEVFSKEVGNGTAAVLTGLTNGQRYYYRVAAKSLIGEGPKSNETSATPAAKPAPPMNLNAMAGNRQVRLTWSPPVDDGGFGITNYSVWRGISPGGEISLTVIGNTLSFTDTALRNGMVYFYTVAARNALGESYRSNEANATPIGVPGPPTNLSTFKGNGRITLTWSPPTDDGGAPITSYSLCRGTTSGGEVFLAMVGKVLTHNDSGLVNGIRYYYKVSARNAAGEGENSTETSGVPMTAPSAPSSLTASAGNRKVMLTWSPPASDGGSGVTGYRIYRGNASGQSVFLAATGIVSTYADAGLANGVSYRYSISAVNEAGEGGRSPESIATPSNRPPTCAITSPAANSTLSGIVDVLGLANDSDGIVQMVEVGIDGGEWRRLDGDSSWNYSWDTDRVADGPHAIRARAFDGEDYSAELIVAVTVLNRQTPPPGGENTSMESWVMPVMGAASVLALVATVFLLLRKKRRRAGCEQYPPAPNRKER